MKTRFLSSILCLAFAVASPLRAAEKTTPAIVPVFSLSGSFSETPLGEDLLFGGGGGESFQQLLARLKKAKDDDQVKSLVFLLDSTSLGAAQVEELRRAMDDMKAAGKEIHVHSSSLSMRAYAIASGATSITVVPTGDLWLTGIYGQSLHLRGLLDKIGVSPDFLTCGAYKSAAEMFTRKGPSPEANENLNWLLDSMSESQIKLIAEGRGVDADKVRQWIDKGLYGAAQAKQAGIIDAVAFRSDMEANLKDQWGDNVRLSRRYGKKDPYDIDFSSPFGIIKFYSDLLAGPKKSKSGKTSIAIVYVEGAIMPGSGSPSAFPFGATAGAYSTPIRKALEKVANDDSVKGVVLRVNSPGGSAVASEIILQATRQLAEKKPFVVSMGDVAGSGGYYVACATDTIYAEPSTMTASIGVVGGKLATGGLWDRLGVNFHEYRRGKNSGILFSSQPFTTQERETMQAWMDEVYGVFKGHVLAARKDRLKKPIDELAGGRVFTGRQALELGLVDKLGGLQDAIADVAKRANIDKYEIRVEPKPKSFLELLTAKSDDNDSSSLRLAAGRQISTDLWTQLGLESLRIMDPARLSLVHSALGQLDILQRESISLSMPVIEIGGR